ncbi:MAG: ABC transporter permease [Calditrichaeota bacterium]|nr:MAG: ABC transporter permease [Calditrichota bacterium]
MLWLLKMAWRDSRNNRKRLLLFISSIVLGIAALVAISSFGENLEKAVNEQSKSLLGADLSIQSSIPFNKNTKSLFDSLGGEQATEISFSSMAFFPKNDGTRLSQIRALEGKFPFYGNLETEPKSAYNEFLQKTGALVDYSLMLQYELEKGDSVKLGEKVFEILGELKKVPGQAAVGGIIAPRIYIPFSDLEETNLVQFGSRATYKQFFKFDSEFQTDSLVKKIQPILAENQLRSRTVESQRRRFERVLGNLYQFLSLAGFIALVLGSIGVASSVNVYIKQKINTIAILRCLGAEIGQTFNIYLIQTTIMGFVGSLLGVVLGVATQNLIPFVLKDFLVVDIEFSISLVTILKGFTVGLGVTVLFSLLPLISIRKVSPLTALRNSFETQDGKDFLKWVVYGIIIVGVTLFAIFQTQDLVKGLAFTAGLGVAFGTLAGFSKLIIYLIKKFFPKSWNYVFRQSLANLYRPNNQTLILTLAIGLGTYLIATLQQTQDTLLNQVSLTGSKNQPNLVIFDIQTDQNKELNSLLKSENLPLIENVPIVTTRLKSVKGIEVEILKEDSLRTIPRWALRREYRVTYRDSMTSAEELLQGNFVTEKITENDSIFVSLEKGIAKDLNVNLGDEITFDVQGIPIQTFVGSVREVDWQKIQPNFFVIFPKGILEAAPQTFVTVTSAPNTEVAASFQKKAVKDFPNVSVIDLALILRTVDSILEKVSFVIQFMALFSILTGLIVLASAVITTRFQRVRESVLLRTLGASKAQILTILHLEYLYLGALSAFTGISLSLIASWALSEFVFKTVFIPSFGTLGLVFLTVVFLTILIGMLNSRGIAKRPPLEILRED